MSSMCFHHRGRLESRYVSIIQLFLVTLTAPMARRPGGQRVTGRSLSGETSTDPVSYISPAVHIPPSTNARARSGVSEPC